MDDQEFQDHLKGMREQQAIFWIMPDRDEISPMVDGAIKQVEAITDAAAKEYNDPLGWWDRWMVFANPNVT